MSVLLPFVASYFELPERIESLPLKKTGPTKNRSRKWVHQKPTNQPTNRSRIVYFCLIFRVKGLGPSLFLSFIHFNCSLMTHISNVEVMIDPFNRNNVFVLKIHQLSPKGTRIEIRRSTVIATP